MQAAIAKCPRQNNKNASSVMDTNALANAFIAVDQGGKPHDGMRIKFEKRSAYNKTTKQSFDTATDKLSPSTDLAFADIATGLFNDSDRHQVP